MRFNGTCTTWPVVSIEDLGTSASAATGTVLLTMTATAAGVFTASGSLSVASGHYLGVVITDTISCSAYNWLDVSMTY